MENVAHKGKIVSITPQFTTVEIISQPACSSCHAAGLCGMSEYTKKAIEVPTRSWDSYEVGQEVNVVLKASMGHKAVWIAYAIPLVIMVAVLLGMSAAGAGELLSGAAAIGSVALWYIVVWLFRERLKNEYIFEINN